MPWSSSPLGSTRSDHVGCPDLGRWLWTTTRPWSARDLGAISSSLELQVGSTTSKASSSAIKSSSGAFLEDAVVVSCGHSFGGDMLKKVLEMGRPGSENIDVFPAPSCSQARCSLCNSEIETGTQIPNYALRAAAMAVKVEDDRRLFHNAVLRKRRKEMSDQMDTLKRLNKTPSVASQNGNRRTPDKFVGKEAVITSQCLNGWYLLKILDSGESVRLQYRSLRKVPSSQEDERSHSRTLIQAGS
ncbi:hypothetical protein Taro_010904 [Colocasia esculenta]|uniref:PUB 62/63 C-terminal domain-containing protein n=1 Tax=Colocasia esculenta TaxID=4460 RepID=A0A843U8T7_COLES|nr:hypothetical protein [Colocasia esculenta]